MKKILFLAVMLFPVFMYSSEKPGVKFIPLAELQRLIKADDDGLLIVDVLGPESYRRAHIKGAVNIPLAVLGEEKNILLLRRYKTIVVYCSGPACSASVKAAELLVGMGFVNVFSFKGGMKEWTEAALPVEAVVSAGD